VKEREAKTEGLPPWLTLPWWPAPTIQALVAVLRSLPTDAAPRRELAVRAREALLDAERDAERRAGGAVLTDLVLHGWRVEPEDLRVRLWPPTRVADRAGEKARVMEQLAVERQRQLEEPAVRHFIHRLERPRRFRGVLRSVYSLMRDGRDLARALSDGQGRAERLRHVIQPYVQVVEDDARCEWTGLALQDVWRYFRHTWATPYKQTPGRGMALLIRDAAVEPHPVVGIALIGSPASQITVRDSWIGWSSDAVLAECRTAPTLERAEWLERTLNEELGEIYFADLLADDVLALHELSAPSEATCERLRAEARARREEHMRFSSPATIKRATEEAQGDDAAWATVSRLPLYRAKRAELLASLLVVRGAMRRFGRIDASNLARFARSSEGIAAIRTLAQRSKARRMGIAVGEIAVCGAVSPYREILGGKLVSLLLMSPEVRQAYAARYDEAESLIASATAGRAVRREPSLALLMTTSLYASSASQYNRVRLPRAALGAVGPELYYEPIGVTKGYGSSQFSDGTIDLISTLLSQVGDGRRINSVFGEGVNPRLRKAREGLQQLGLPADKLLQHGSPRLVYAIPLIDNVRPYLQGLDTEPRWSLRNGGPASTEAIAEWWRSRWLAARSTQPEVLAAVAGHTLERPVRHGARVELPADAQMSLFQ
jgi:hypothetical protein